MSNRNGTRATFVSRALTARRNRSREFLLANWPAKY